MLDRKASAVLCSTDLTRSQEFYEQKVGLKLSPETIRNHLLFECGNGTTLLVYGRRAAAVLGLAALAIAARIWAGPHWLSDLGGGGLAGALLGSAAYLATLRLFPAGHLAAVRGERRARHQGAAVEGSGPIP